MLKRLFCASASILMLALAYHLGATTATAQAGSWRWVGGSSEPIVASGGALWYIGNGWQAASSASSDPLPVPPSDIAAVESSGGYISGIITTSGVGWRITGGLNTSPWVNYGPVPGATTPAAQPTFGQLKVQYRK